MACGGQVASSPSEIQSITLHSTGGFIGEDLTYVLQADGSIVTTGHGTSPTGTTHAPGGAADASALFGDVLGTKVMSVSAGNYLPSDTCCDRIEDDLTIAATTGTNEWQVMADGAGAPAEVLSALQLVHAYVGAAH